MTGFDARFPNQNQTKHCWQNYVDYHKCVNAKGEDFMPCKQFYYAYRSLCPNAWLDKWDTQRGLFPSSPFAEVHVVDVGIALQRTETSRPDWTLSRRHLEAEPGGWFGSEH